MKRLKLFLITLFVSITTLYAQINFKTFENENMVEIVSEDSYILIEDISDIGITQDLFGNKIDKIFGYSISKYEVTQDLYRSVIGTNPSCHKGDKLPVECVTWYDAVYFCNELTKMTMGEENCYYEINNIKKNDSGSIEKAQIIINKSKNGYRLPTQIEWELAARGGCCGGWNYKYSGNDELKDVGWYKDNSGGKTHIVGKKKANKAGIYDMSGNVREWCWDYASNYGYIKHHYRGGSFTSDDSQCKVSYWNFIEGCIGVSNLGFRVCRSL